MSRPLRPGSLGFLVPGDWNLPTGGYTYDRRLVAALQSAGAQVLVCRADGAWPSPSQADLARTNEALWRLPDQTLLVADGLAFGAMAELVSAHAHRLRWVALVHHPLHMETGLTPQQRQHLAASETAALRHALRVVVTSAATLLDVVAMGVPVGQVRVVEPGTDPPTMTGAPPRPVPGPAQARPLQLLCVATLTPRKGHSLLLEALAGLTHLAWELHCVGSADRDPAHAALLRGQASPLGRRVQWHGEVDATALRAHYTAADAFVLPSLHEGFGMVVTEALSYGLPVVATDAGALAQTLPVGAGLQVAAGEVAPLQSALEQILTRPDLRMKLAANARACALSLPTWAQQADRFLSALEDLP